MYFFGLPLSDNKKRYFLLSTVKKLLRNRRDLQAIQNNIDSLTLTFWAAKIQLSLKWTLNVLSWSQADCNCVYEV